MNQGHAEGKVDRKHVQIGEPVERLYWTTRLGASALAVQSALDAVGDEPARVEAWLYEHKLCHLRVDYEAAHSNRDGAGHGTDPQA